MIRTITILMAAALLTGWLSGCSQRSIPPSAVTFGTFTDARDGQTYKTVKIGNQTWMAQNINYQTESGSWCYENKADNCKPFGRLYDWNTATTVCPKGWKLPSCNDWIRLVTTAGGSKTAAKKLKSKGWIDYDSKDRSGTDDFGFSTLPSGYRRSDGYFDNAGYNGYWWTATEINRDDAYIRYTHCNYDFVAQDHDSKSNGYSVRCIEDSADVNGVEGNCGFFVY